MKSNAGDLQCPCCKECKDCITGFQKVVDLKNAGLVIYRHTIETEDVNKDTGITEFATKTTEDVFILHNIKDMDVTSADCLPEIERSKIKCPRCRRIIEHAQKLLQKVPTINRHDVKGICEHCRMKEPCFECEEVVKKFIARKTERAENTKERVKLWLSKIKYLLKDALVDATETGHERARAYSELNIDKLCRRASPEVSRKPEVKQMYQPAYGSDFVGAFPPSVEKRNKMFAHLPQLEKFERPIAYFDSLGKSEKSSFRTKGIYKTDQEHYYSDPDSDDWRATFYSPTTEKDSQKQKKEKHVEIRDYIPPVPFHSKEDFIAERDEIKFDDGLGRRITRPKSRYANEEYDPDIKRFVKTGKDALNDGMLDNRDAYELGLETIPVDYLGNFKYGKAPDHDQRSEFNKTYSLSSSKSGKEYTYTHDARQEKMADYISERKYVKKPDHDQRSEFNKTYSLSSSKAGREYTNTFDARHEKAVDYFSKLKYLKDPDRYQKSEHDDYSSDSSKKYSNVYASRPPTMASDFYAENAKEDGIKHDHDNIPKIKQKHSLGSSKADQKYSKESRESPNVVRKYHSEEALLTTENGVIKDVLKQEFSFYFPKELSAEKKLKRQKSSSELIKDTQNMLLARAEDEKRRLEDERKRKLQEEERKKLAREERRKELEVKRKTEEENKKEEEKKYLEIELAKQVKCKVKEVETPQPEKTNANKVKITPTVSNATTKSKGKESRPVSEKKDSKSEVKKLSEEPKLLKESKLSKPPKEARELTPSKEPKPTKEAREAAQLKEPKPPKEARETAPLKEPKPPKEARETAKLKEPKSPKEARETAQLKEIKLPKEGKERKPPKEPIGTKPKEQESLKEPSEQKQPKEPMGSKPPRETKFPKELEALKEAVVQKPPKESRASKPAKESKDSKLPKDTIEMKPLKELKDPSEPKPSKEPKSLNEPKANKDKDIVRADKQSEKSRKYLEKEELLRKDKEAKENLKKEKEEEMEKSKKLKQIEKNMIQQEKEEKRREKEEIAKQKVKDTPPPKQIDKEQSKQAEKEVADKQAKEEARIKLKIALDTEAVFKSEPEKSKAPKYVEETKTKDLNINQIKMKRPSTDDLILRLVRIKQSTNVGVRVRPKRLAEMKLTSNDVKRHMDLHKPHKPENCLICFDSSMELDAESIFLAKDKKPKADIILGEKIFKFKPPLAEKKENQIVPLVFQSTFDSALITVPPPSEPIKVVGESPQDEKKVPPLISSGKHPKSQTVEQEVPKGVIRYALSDRSFIDKGWTMLPTEKVVRKMNVYRMRPAHPEFDWFEHNKNKRLMSYDSGEKLAEFDDNGRGRWFYRSGRLALDYYDAAEINAQQRFVIYSSGEPDEKGRAQPYTILATFDYLGNGIVFDHGGKIRLKYNQTEGVVLDRSIGPVSHWKWHTLNDPPVLQQVMIDTELAHKDPAIMKLGGPLDNKTRPDNEDMLAIEFDNFIKEKSKKLTQTFKPFQIKMKALKINEHFSLRVLDQATVYLIYRDGTTNLKLNIGMVLDHKEIVDTDTAEVGEVSNSMEHFPARTDSLAGLQKSIAHVQHYERNRTERERRLRPPEPSASADQLTAAASRPLRPPFRTAVSSKSSTTTAATNSFSKCRKPTTSNVYYDSRLC